MAALVTKAITTRSDQVAPTFVSAAGGGDTFTPSDRSFLVVRTVGTGTTVTLGTPGKLAFDGATDMPDLAITIGTNSERWIGPLSPAYFDGTVTYSAVTAVTVGVYSI